MFYFLSVWGGTERGVTRVKAALELEHFRASTNVGWTQCCQSRQDGGINLIHLGDAVTTLLFEWIVKSLEPIPSNLHLMLKFRFSHFQPYWGKWQPNLEYFTLPRHQSKMDWDPGRYRWGERTLMQYMAACGQTLLKKRHKLLVVTEAKWAGVVPLNFKLRWLNEWNLGRIRKEAGLLWLIWHRAVVVNAWRRRIDNAMDQCCPICLNRARESVLHHFWECSSAQKSVAKRHLDFTPIGAYGWNHPGNHGRSASSRMALDDLTRGGQPPHCKYRRCQYPRS